MEQITADVGIGNKKGKCWKISASLAASVRREELKFRVQINKSGNISGDNGLNFSIQKCSDFKI